MFFFSGDLITSKWNNLRDAFVRSLKQKSGQGSKKKYIYYENLQFLMKIVEKDKTESSIRATEHDEIEGSSDNETDTQIQLQTREEQVNQPKKKAKTTKPDRLETDIIKALSEKPDEDESFFFLLFCLL